MLVGALWLSLIAVKVFRVVAFCPGPSVISPQGVINGTVLRTRNGRTFSAFLGVPYAEPPVGDLRFRSPVPKRSWNDTLLAKYDKPECPQLRSDGSQAGQEDCLYLNIYTPQICDGREKLLPVIFYVSGGKFVGGSGRSDKWGPQYILDKDVIMVLLNYRLGILGFLSTGDDSASGNFGMKDQVLAMKWVQENIQAFGGDPRRVTLIGHSAGGLAVRYHLLSPKSAGFYQQCAIMSGTMPRPWRFKNITEYSSYARKAADRLGCPTNNSVEIVSCLRQASVSQLLNVKVTNYIELPDIFDVWAVVTEPESEDAFLTVNPDKLEEFDKMPDLPFMAGIVQYDGFFATYPMFINDSMRSNIMKNVSDAIRQTLEIYELSPRSENNTDQFVKDIVNYYFSANASGDNLQDIVQLTRYFTDMLVAYPFHQLLQRRSSLALHPIYVYQYDYCGTFSRMTMVRKAKNDIGPGHADELIYLFPHNPDRFSLTSVSFNSNDEQLIDIMVELFTSFAETGVPTSKFLTSEWRPYETDSRNYLHVTKDSANGAPVLTPATNYLDSLLNTWRVNSSV